MPEQRLTKLMKDTKKHPGSKAFETLQKAEVVHCGLQQNGGVMIKEFIGRFSLKVASPIWKKITDGASDLTRLDRSLINMIPHVKDSVVRKRYAAAKEGGEAKAVPKPQIVSSRFLNKEACRYPECGVPKDKFLERVNEHRAKVKKDTKTRGYSSGQSEWKLGDTTADDKGVSNPCGSDDLEQVLLACGGFDTVGRESQGHDPSYERP